MPFDAIDAGNDNDVVETDSPRTVSVGARGEAAVPATLHASSDYALVGFSSNRGAAKAGDEYSSLPAGVGVPAVANGNAERTEYDLPPPPAFDTTLARSDVGAARPRSPTTRRAGNVEYDRVMLTPRYDQPGDKFE